MTKLTTRETRTIVAALRGLQRRVEAVERGNDDPDFGAASPLVSWMIGDVVVKSAQLDRLRERIAKAKNINLS